jgi:hypothetical protein
MRKRTMIIRGPFEKLVNSTYKSESEICGGAVTVTFSKDLPPLASDAPLTMLHPLLENMLQTVCRKIQEDSGTGGFDLGASFSFFGKPTNLMRRDLDCMEDVLMWFHRPR